MKQICIFCSRIHSGSCDSDLEVMFDCDSGSACSLGLFASCDGDLHGPNDQQMLDFQHVDGRIRFEPDGKRYNFVGDISIRFNGHWVKETSNALAFFFPHSQYLRDRAHNDGDDDQVLVVRNRIRNI